MQYIIISFYLNSLVAFDDLFLLLVNVFNLLKNNSIEFQHLQLLIIGHNMKAIIGLSVPEIIIYWCILKLYTTVQKLGSVGFFLYLSLLC